MAASRVSGAPTTRHDRQLAPSPQAAGTRLTSRERQLLSLIAVHIETVERHHLGPGSDEIAHELLSGVVGETAPPPEFDGPGGIWSPESLLCAAVADCFILTFRGVSRGAKLEWPKLECRVEGTLERVTGPAQFNVPTASKAAKARALLERAEHGCLISNSLRGIRTLESETIEMPVE